MNQRIVFAHLRPGGSSLRIYSTITTIMTPTSGGSVTCLGCWWQDDFIQIISYFGGDCAILIYLIRDNRCESTLKKILNSHVTVGGIINTPWYFSLERVIMCGLGKGFWKQVDLCVILVGKSVDLTFSSCHSSVLLLCSVSLG